jgi:hypothetical protein
MLVIRTLRNHQVAETAALSAAQDNGRKFSENA